MAAVSSIIGGIGAAAGIGSVVTGARAARDQNRLQQQALAQSRTELGSFGFNNPWGVQSGFDPATGTVNLSAGGLDSVRDALSRFATESAPVAGTGLPDNMAGILAQLQGFAGRPPTLSVDGPNGLDQLTGRVGSTLDDTQGQFQQLSAGGFQRPLQNTAFMGAGNQLADLNRVFGDVQSQTLGQLRAQAQPFEQRAFDSLQNNQFATGRLGSSGGALQTEAFARGLGQADLSRQLEATNQARLTQQNTLGLAQGLTGMGSGLAGMESDLLSSAFNRFGQTAQMASDLNRERFTRSMYGDETMFSRLGSILGAQQGAAMMPSQLQGAQLQNVLSALGGQAGIQTQGLQGFQAALAAAQAQANARIGAGSNMASIVGNPNFATSGMGTSNLLGQLSERFAPPGGYMNQLASLFGGNRSMNFTPTMQDVTGSLLGNVPAPRIGGL